MKKRRTNNWIKFGVPVIVLVIVGGVVAALLVTRIFHKTNAHPSSGASGGGEGPGGADFERFATATNAEWQMPIYPSSVRSIYYVPLYSY